MNQIRFFSVIAIAERTVRYMVQPQVIISPTTNIIIDKSLGTVGRLLLQDHSRWPKWKWRQYESKLMLPVNYLPVIGCEHDAAYWNEIGKTTDMARRNSWRPTYIPINETKPPKMTKSTSTDVTFGGAWSNRVIPKQVDSHSMLLQQRHK